MNMMPTRQKLAAARVLVVGDAMLDRYWYGAVYRISPEAPVPVVRVTREEERIGAAANVAYNVVTLGAQASLLTVVGDDEASHKLEELVARTGIEPHFGRDPQLKTTVKLRVIGRQQQLLRIDFEKAPSHEVLLDKLTEYRKLLKTCDVIILSDYGKGGLKHIVEMIRLARLAKKQVLVDPKGDDYSRYSGATVVTPNRGELREVVGRWSNERDLNSRAQALRRSLRLQALLLTRSEEGMSLFDEGGVRHEPAKAREVFDVSGAGDTVIGALSLMVAAGSDLAAAMRVANHAAGIVVGKLGTAVVHRDELLASLASNP
jgi:rfaE bifunctional protein kinase chain/domain